MDQSRQTNIDRFGRFVKDLPFIELSEFNTRVETSSLESTTRVILGNLACDESLAISRNLSEFFDSVSRNGAAFERFAARSGQKSRHGVFFGDIRTTNELSERVAIKIFDEDQGGIRAAVNEVVKSRAVLSGGIRTFEPIAVGRYSGTSYSMWALEQGASTLESIDWTSYSSNPTIHPGMTALLEKAGVQTAEIHARGWGHGDYHPKNIATNPIGHVFPIDWEDALLTGDVTDESVRYERAYLDLASFVTSCFYNIDHPFNPGIGLFHNTDTNTAMSLLDEKFFKPYISHRMKLEKASRIPEDIRQLMRDIHDLPNMIVTK